MMTTMFRWEIYLPPLFCFIYNWSALATTPASISARAGAKEAINFIETFAFFALPVFVVSKHK